MAEVVKPEIIKKTQDLLGKYFDKPPLTEKLLKKPPFRFLHDIITAVIKKTGFLDGLYSDWELNSENIKDKEAKLAFLTKLIDVVKLITGTNLSVRASKVISGQEPAKTNELLQSIGRALNKGISSAEAVEHYKKSLNKKSKTPSKDKNVEKLSKPQQKTEKNKPLSEPKKKSGQSISKDAKTSKDTIKKPITEDKIVQQENVIDKMKNNEPEEIQKRSSSGKTKTTKVPSEVIQNENEKEEDRPRPKSKSLLPTESIEISSEEKNIPNSILSTETIIDDVKTNDDDEIKKSNEPNQLETDSSVPSNVNKLENGRASISHETTTRPRTSLRPPSARPISARPAAPRMRIKTEMIVNEEIVTPLGNINVIVENSDTRDDDDAEDMVVMEAKTNIIDAIENESNYKSMDNQLTQEHGHLVAQILETQRELIHTDNVDVIPKKVDITWESGSKRDREAIVKEIDQLRGTIQILTRVTNPLGKLLDYLQEDVEIMEKELLEWQTQYDQLGGQLEKEQTQTKESIEPMRRNLEEIDNRMDDQLDKICQVKYRIMKNDQKIQRLLNGHL